MGGYRYGFNGKENDNEVKGEGNQVAFEERTYDPRLGVFLSRDPLAEKYPSQSPYVFAANSPIQFVDVLGMGPGPSFIGYWVANVLKDFPFFTDVGKRNKQVLINGAEKVAASSLGVLSGLTPGPRRSAESIGLYVHQDWFEGGVDVGEAGAPATSLLSGGSGMAPKLAVSMGAELKMAKPLGLSINVTSTLLANSQPEGAEDENHEAGNNSESPSTSAFDRYPGVAKEYAKQTASQLRKTIRSTANTIAEHVGWVNDPLSKPGMTKEKWASMPSQARIGLLNKWTKDIDRNKGYLEIAEELLKTKTP